MNIHELVQKINVSSKPTSIEDELGDIKFLDQCNSYLYSFFSEFFEEEFNFSALSFTNIHSKSNFDFAEGVGKKWSYSFNETNLKGTETLRKLFQEFIEEAKSDKTINLTQVLTDDNNADANEEFLAYGFDNNENILNRYNLNLDKIDFNTDFDKFLDNNASEIQSFILSLKGDVEEIEKFGRYVYNYKRIVDQYAKDNPKRPFNLYFIKPTSVITDFRILLSLSISRTLTNEERGIVSLILHKIISHTAIGRLNRLVKAEQEAKKNVAYQKMKNSIMELNAYHHFGNNLSYIQQQIDLDSFGFQNLTDDQVQKLSNLNKVTRSFGTNIRNTLSLYKEYVRKQNNNNNSYKISSLIGEIDSHAHSKREELKPRIGFTNKFINEIPRNASIDANPSLVSALIFNQIDNMVSEFQKIKVETQDPKIIMKTEFFWCDKKNGEVIFSLYNNFSKLKKNLLKKVGIEPIGSGSSTGLGFYFFNEMLGWLNAINYDKENRSFSVKNEKNAEKGVTITFKLRMRNNE